MACGERTLLGVLLPGLTFLLLSGSAQAADACASTVCQNGGSCTASADGTSYNCSCAPGYIGNLCQTNKDDCAGNPCQNGGICSDGIASFSCACAPGFLGLTCGTNMNDCDSDACQNGGTCVDGVNSYTCTCPPGYTGELCETAACESALFRELFQNVSRTLFGAFEQAPDSAVCRRLEEELTLMDTAWTACSNSPVLSSTARVSVMRFTLRPYLVAFRALKADVCGSSSAVQVDSGCKVDDIIDIFHTFFDMALSGSLVDTCRAASMEKQRLMVALRTCSLATRSALTLMTSQLGYTAGAFCAPSGCNPDYVKLCVSEGEAALSAAMVDEKEQLPNDTCRRVKLSLACSANHTVDCSVEQYMSVNVSVKALRDVYVSRCPQTPKSSCLQAPGQMLADMAQVIKSGVVLKEQVCKYQGQAQHVAMAAQDARLSEEERYDLKQSSDLVSQLLSKLCAPVPERCKMNPETGMCKASMPRYFYNASAEQCQQFTYGGCGGNDNRFSTIDECQAACQTPQVPVKTCSPESFQVCMTGVVQNPCSNLDSVQSCYQQRLNGSGCTDADRAMIYGGFNLMSGTCGSNKRLQFDDSNPQARALNRIMACYSAMPSGASQGSSNLCSNYDAMLSCMVTALDGLPSAFRIQVQEAIDTMRRVTGTGFCDQGAANALASCNTQTLTTAMECYGNYTVASGSQGDAETLCSRRKEIEACLRPRDNCSMIREMSRVFNETVNSTCAVYMARHTQGCQPDKVSQCFELAANRIPGDECSASFVNAAACAERESTGCPRDFKERVSKAGRLLLRVGAGLCGQCPPEDRPVGCDPPEAVLCVLDIQHQAKCGTPDWEDICKSLDGANQCVERHIRTCAVSEQRVVQDIVTRINQQVKDMCLRPPVERCESGEAMACIDKVKAVWRNGGGDSSSVCLAVAAARTCIVARTKYCDNRTRIGLEVELRMLLSSFAYSCEQKEVDVCIDAFRTRVSAILSYTPIAMEKQCSSDECGDNGKAKDEKKDSGEKDSGEKDSGEKNSGEKNSGEKNSGEKNSGEKNSGEKDDAASTYRPLEVGMRALCGDLGTAWTCMQSQLRSLPADRAQALNATLSTLWVLVRDACREAEPLTCYSCKNEDSNDDCNDRAVEICPWNKQMCQTDVHVNKDGSTKKVSKGCVPPPSCKSGCRGAKCTYCCDGYKCNHPLHGPISGTCDVKRAAVIVFNMAMQLLSSDKLNCTLLELELTSLETVRTQCRLAGSWALLEVTESLYVSSVVRQCKARIVEPNCGLHGVLSLATLLSHSIDREHICKAVDTTVAAVEAIERFGQCSEAELRDLRGSFRMLTTQLADYGCPGTVSLWETQPFKEVCEGRNSQDCRTVLTCNATQSFNTALATLRQGEGSYCSRWSQSLAGFQGDNYTESGCPEEARTYFVTGLTAMADVDMLTNSCKYSYPNDLWGALAKCVATFHRDLRQALTLGSTTSVCQAAQTLGYSFLQAPYSNLQTLSSLERLYLSQMGFIVQQLATSLCDYGNSEGVVAASLSESCVAAYDAAKTCLSDYVFDFPFLPWMPATERHWKCRKLAQMDRCVAVAQSSCPSNAVSSLYSVYRRMVSTAQGLCGPQARREPHCDPMAAINCFQTAATYRMSLNVSREQLCRSVEEALNCSMLYSQGCPSGSLQMAEQASAMVKWGVLDSCPSLAPRLYCTDTTADCSIATVTLRIGTCVMKFIPSSNRCGSFNEVITCARDVVSPCAAQKETLRSVVSSTLRNDLMIFDTLLSDCNVDLDRDLFSATVATPTSFPATVATPTSCRVPVCNLTAAYMCTVESSSADAFACVTGNITDCNSLQATLALLQLQQDGTTLSVPSRTDSLALLAQFAGMLAEGLRGALDAPQFQQWDFCVLLNQTRDQLTTIAESTDGQVLQYLMVSQRAGLDHFLNTVCNDNGTFSEMYDTVEEADTCQKSFLTRATVSMFLRSLLYGFLPISDGDMLCRSAAMLETRVMAETRCSQGLLNRLTLGVKAVKAVLGRGCHSHEFCSLKMAKACVARLQSHVAQYSVNVSRDDICMALHHTDNCVEQYVSSCLPFLEEVKTFKVIYSWNRMFAVALCGDQELSTPTAKCQAEVTERAGAACTPSDVFPCVSAGFEGLVWPLYSQKKRCRAAAEARACYVSKQCGNEAAAEAMLWTPLREDAMTCPAEEEVECMEGCSLQRAGQCLHSLYTAIQPWSSRRHGFNMCRSATEARLCLLKESRTCPTSQRTILDKKLTALLRTVPLGEKDCQYAFTCLADFQIAVQEMFAPPVKDTPASGDDKKNTTNEGKKDESGEDKDDKQDKTKSATNATARHYNLPALCARARGAWLCLQTAMALLPEAQRLPLLNVLEGVWSAVQFRCEDTLQQSCYACDGAKNEDKCNENQQLCGYDQQMCLSQLWIEGGSPKFRKQCMRPDECVPCTGDGCDRETFCCKGDLCNQRYSSVSDVQEPVTCRVEKAIGCAVQYMSAYLRNGSIECSMAQTATLCMERYSATCRSEALVAIATAAYTSLRCLCAAVVHSDPG